MNTILKRSWMAFLALSLQAAEPAAPAKSDIRAKAISTNFQASTTNLVIIRADYLARAAYQNAVKAGDREVVAAAEYNLLHIEAVESEDATARTALARLASLGDEFTLEWLDRPEGVTWGAARLPLIQSTLQQIRARLKTTPIPPAKQVRAWLLRAAVSDITCNVLEVRLGQYRQSWLSRHSTNAAVRSELNALRQQPIPEGEWPSPQFIRRRAISYIDVGPARPPAPRSDR